MMLVISNFYNNKEKMKVPDTPNFSSVLPAEVGGVVPCLHPVRLK